MIRLLFLFLLVFQSPLGLEAQSGQSFDMIDAVGDPNPAIQQFYQQFEEWLAAIQNGTQVTLDEKRMVNNFIIFSEDGLIMKDLQFHTVASCREHILKDLPEPGAENPWIYVAMESHVNRSELLEMLTFLKAQKIDVEFGREEEFVSKMMKK